MTQAGRVDERAKYYLIVLTAALLIPATLGSSKSIFNDGDVSWHIATGQWILAHGQIPRTDPFSFTWAGKPWVPIEWFAETIMASAYRFAGYSGISALATAALIALHAVIVSNATRFVRPLSALGAIVAMDVVLIPMMLARPHLLAWALLAFWTVLMVHARKKDGVPPLAAALLMVVWTNLHGSFVIGLVVAAALGLEALLASSDRSRALRQWGLFGVACLIAVFVNANGLEGVLHPLKIANLSMLPLVDEWKPSNPAVTPFFFVVLAGVLALIWVKRPAMHPVRWVLLCALLGLALLQVRHQAVLAIVAAVILPEAFAKGSARGEAEGRIWWLVGAAAATLIVVRLFMPMTPPENEANPWNLIAAVPPDLRSQPVLNGYVMGGPLILSGIRTYVDGRGTCTATSSSSDTRASRMATPRSSKRRFSDGASGGRSCLTATGSSLLLLIAHRAGSGFTRMRSA
ncbi:hypothetical protein H9L14_08540 [Sphingomonas sediminicola]|uniref:Glycosyltransferase family 39 protein n=1 Tax=Sphingomonas sediminicola TaxID=386874 RepID=A0ABX6T4K5_9SPHN|nr:hypothetical protein [Sphingomonas sediminicola]QNP44812.1 hypothetical protein H9L14_08540 [Sphingomonas sediminicola]